MESFNTAPPDGEPYRAPRVTSREEALQRLDGNVAKARDAISGTDDAELMIPWPLNHTIHHRGQLTVYLRLKDVPLPGIYGSEVEA